VAKQVFRLGQPSISWCWIQKHLGRIPQCQSVEIAATIQVGNEESEQGLVRPAIASDLHGETQVHPDGIIAVVQLAIGQLHGDARGQISHIAARILRWRESPVQQWVRAEYQRLPQRCR
jgi:hypothetical protein